MGAISVSYGVDWDETTPAGDDNKSLGDDAIRDKATAIRERMQRQHLWASTDDDTDCGKHRQGFVSIVKSDTKTNLDAMAHPIDSPDFNDGFPEDGAIAWDTTNKCLWRSNGTSWAQRLTPSLYHYYNSTVQELTTSYAALKIGAADATSLSITGVKDNEFILVRLGFHLSCGVLNSAMFQLDVGGQQNNVYQVPLIYVNSTYYYTAGGTVVWGYVPGAGNYTVEVNAKKIIDAGTCNTNFREIEVMVMDGNTI